MPGAEVNIVRSQAKDLSTTNYGKCLSSYADGKQINKSDIITLKPEEILKKEYSFDGRNELQAVVIDAETKDTLDKATIKQKSIRDTGGLL